MKGILDRRIAISLGAVIGSALLLATGSVVLASNGTQIRACVAESNGSVRIVQNEDECRRSETPLSWNQSGPPGEAGADGQDGVSGLTTVVFQEDVNLATGPVFDIYATCPFGKRVVGGGGSTSSDHAVMLASVPLVDGVTWVVRFRDLSGISFGTITIRAHAICAYAN